MYSVCLNLHIGGCSWSVRSNMHVRPSIHWVWLICQLTVKYTVLTDYQTIQWSRLPVRNMIPCIIIVIWTSYEILCSALIVLCLKGSVYILTFGCFFFLLKLAHFRWILFQDLMGPSKKNYVFFSFHLHSLWILLYLGNLFLSVR